MALPHLGTTVILASLIFSAITLPTTPSLSEADPFSHLDPTKCSRLQPPDPWSGSQFFPDPPPSPLSTTSGNTTLSGIRNLKGEGETIRNLNIPASNTSDGDSQPLSELAKRRSPLCSQIARLTVGGQRGGIWRTPDLKIDKTDDYYVLAFEFSCPVVVVLWYREVLDPPGHYVDPMQINPNHRSTGQFRFHSQELAHPFYITLDINVPHELNVTGEVALFKVHAPKSIT